MFSLMLQLEEANVCLRKLLAEEKPKYDRSTHPTAYGVATKVRTYGKYEQAMKGKGWITATELRDTIRVQECVPDFTLEGARHALIHILLPAGLVESHEKFLGTSTIRKIREWRWVIVK